MSLYIQLRDEILYDLDEVPVRQYWIKADSIEVLDLEGEGVIGGLSRTAKDSDAVLRRDDGRSPTNGVAYLDSKTGEWRIIDQEGGKFFLGGRLFKHRGVTYPVESHEELEKLDLGYDFLFIRDRLMQGCTLGRSGV